ncbi:MAG: hypothetical protein ACTSXD_08550 [Candidatus Heimdallarchaeaceae archaeon]
MSVRKYFPRDEWIRGQGGRSPGAMGRSCPFCGGSTQYTREGLLKCMNCIRYFQVDGIAYKIKRNPGVV